MQLLFARTSLVCSKPVPRMLQADPMWGDQVPRDRSASRKTITLIQHADIPVQHALANHTYAVYAGTSAEELQVHASNP